MFPEAWINHIPVDFSSLPISPPSQWQQQQQKQQQKWQQQHHQQQQQQQQLIGLSILDKLSSIHTHKIADHRLCRRETVDVNLIWTPESTRKLRDNCQKTGELVSERIKSGCLSVCTPVPSTNGKSLNRLWKKSLRTPVVWDEPQEKTQSYLINIINGGGQLDCAA